LLDLFCGAGGAACGYQRAGFYVVGADHKPQSRYCGDEFVQADALEYAAAHGREFDVIHASPPCQLYSSLRSLHVDRRYPDLYGTLRIHLPTVVPWVIENVIGAPYRSGVVLCGSMFGLPFRRHRNFEGSMILFAPDCAHGPSEDLIGIYGHSDGHHVPGFKQPGTKRGPRQATTAEAKAIMGMPWAEQRKEITEAIPPAYTEFIGRQLFRAVLARKAA